MDAGAWVAVAALVATVVLWIFERRHNTQLTRRQEKAEAESSRQVDDYRAGTARLQEQITDVLKRLADRGADAGVGALREEVARLAEVLERGEGRRGREELNAMVRQMAERIDVDSLRGSARLKVELENRGHGPLLITNLGPDKARLVDVQVVGAPHVLVGPSISGRELEVKESVRVDLALSIADPYPVPVVVAWTDGSGPQERRVKLT